VTVNEARPKTEGGAGRGPAVAAATRRRWWRVAEVATGRWWGGGGRRTNPLYLHGTSARKYGRGRFCFPLPFPRNHNPMVNLSSRQFA